MTLAVIVNVAVVSKMFKGKVDRRGKRESKRRGRRGENERGRRFCGTERKRKDDGSATAKSGEKRRRENNRRLRATVSLCRKKRRDHPGKGAELEEENFSMHSTRAGGVV